jgi:2-oxoglutarate ferredoxin oxidoreductase subunit beta
MEAFRRATETGRFPLGVFYINPHKATFEENTRAYSDSQEPLYRRDLDKEKLAALIQSGV